ncbi:MAG: hypothetical protein C0601_10275 [Candidatus Muiribacterium halophilum]|uniref:Uncharacterized protein n=1 Tax=Muiribacterium halophilum TaxID=2053465 RepID=A0A2N5ZCR1_MUIH1|nr:MAG: hypothetical protein C0601_10275 [Candidatus Muirbacterium halophilum]
MDAKLLNEKVKEKIIELENEWKDKIKENTEGNCCWGDCNIPALGEEKFCLFHKPEKKEKDSYFFQQFLLFL